MAIDTGRKLPLVGIGIMVQTEHNLPDLVLALHDGGSFTHFLNGWQKQAEKQNDNCDDY
jgi:hypothetical protein